MRNSQLWIPSAIPFFLFGYFYYLLSPFFALELFNDNPLLSSAQIYIDTTFFDFRYFLDVALILAFWLIGYIGIQTKRNFKKQSSLDNVVSFRLAQKILLFGLILFLILLMLWALSLGTVFFSGYANYDIRVLGPLSTMISLSVWFLIYVSGKRIKILFFLIFIFCSVVLVGLGSRMYFVLGSIALILGFLSSHKNTLYNPLFYMFLGALFIFVVGVGIWRSEYEFTSEMFVANFLGEPLFTATSASMYIENVGGRPYIGFPSDIFASVINFIPSIIYPGKIDLIREFTYDVNKFSPFGANALIVNIYSNFGIFFPIYFVLIGMFFGFIRKKAYYSLFYRATYFSILPLLMFHFFRDGFITVIKVMFYNSLILPMLIVILLNIVFRNGNIYNKNKNVCSMNGIQIGSIK